MKHTPTPWDKLQEADNSISIVQRDDTEEKSIALIMLDEEISEDEAEANSDFILTACNTHDELVEALNACDEAIEGLLILLPKQVTSLPAVQAAMHAMVVARQKVEFANARGEGVKG